MIMAGALYHGYMWDTEVKDMYRYSAYIYDFDRATLSQAMWDMEVKDMYRYCVDT